MDSADEAKKRQAEIDKAKLEHEALELRIAREQHDRDIAREMERDAASLDDKFR